MTEQPKRKRGRPPGTKNGRKTGGRKKGVQNKVTRELKERIKDFIDGNFDAVAEDLNALDPKDKVQAFIKLLEFVLPKQKEFNLDASDKIEALNVTFKTTGVKPIKDEK